VPHLSYCLVQAVYFGIALIGSTLSYCLVQAVYFGIALILVNLILYDRDDPWMRPLPMLGPHPALVSCRALLW